MGYSYAEGYEDAKEESAPYIHDLEVERDQLREQIATLKADNVELREHIARLESGIDHAGLQREIDTAYRLGAEADAQLATLKAAARELLTTIRAELEWYPLRTWAALDALAALVGEGES
jgi:cell division protein FtsB